MIFLLDIFHPRDVRVIPPDGVGCRFGMEMRKELFIFLDCKRRKVMKKLVVLAMLAAFVLGSVGMAQAVELKAKGNWRVHANIFDNKNFVDDKTDKFEVKQRVRSTFEFVASENLKAVLQLEIGDLTWGGGNGGALNSDGVNVETKHAFLDFNLFGGALNMKTGIQFIGLPAMYGSQILAADVAAVAATMPFSDMMGLTFVYARPYDQSQNNGSTTDLDDEVDVFAAILPINLDGIQLNPFAVYARWGQDFLNETFEMTDAKNANQFFGGLNMTVDMLDPFVIMADFNYGTVKLADNFKAAGFNTALSLKYKMGMMTPEIFGIYETGEDSKYATGGDSSRMPTIGTDGTSWAPTTLGMVGSSFSGASGLMRYYIAELPGTSPMDTYWANEGSIGMWAAAAKLGDIQFIDKLTHELTFLYAQGTNDTANTQLFTKDDSYYELTFNNNYKLYENLSLLVELGWGKMELDELSVGRARKDLAKDDVMKAAFGFQYKF